MTKYLRSKNNGVIFDWNETLARNPNVEELSEEEAYPERFAPVDLSKRTQTIDLSVPKEVVTPPVDIAPELLAEASKPFGRGARLAEAKPKKQNKTAFVDVVGLIGDF